MINKLIDWLVVAAFVFVLLVVPQYIDQWDGTALHAAGQMVAGK